MAKQEPAGMARSRGADAARERRHWASGQEPTLFELISDSYSEWLPTGSALRVRPVCVDADVLLKEIAAEVKRPGEVVLNAASRLGLLRIYVADTIPAEVERNLERVCAEVQRDYAAGLRRGDDSSPKISPQATKSLLLVTNSGTRAATFGNPFPDDGRQLVAVLRRIGGVRTRVRI